MIRIAVARFPGTSSENYSPCNHANGGCNLERGTPTENVLPGVDADGPDFAQRGGSGRRFGTATATVPAPA